MYVCKHMTEPLATCFATQHKSQILHATTILCIYMHLTLVWTEWQEFLGRVFFLFFFPSTSCFPWFFTPSPPSSLCYLLIFHLCAERKSVLSSSDTRQGNPELRSTLLWFAHINIHATHRSAWPCVNTDFAFVEERKNVWVCVHDHD